MKGRRYRVAIQSRPDTLDGDGWRDARQASWSTVTTVWARVEPSSAYERQAANQRVSDVDYIVTIRYHAFPEITAKHRLTYTENTSPSVTRILNIEGVLPDRHLREIRLECREGSDRG